MYQSANAVTVERRIAPRVLYRMDLLTPKRQLLGCTLDLSRTGMRVLCLPEVDIVQASKLRLVLPGWMQLGDGLDLKGHFVWCKAGGARGTEAGFAFQDQQDKTVRRLEEVVEKLSRSADEDRE